jgi:hypothetical protein
MPAAGQLLLKEITMNRFFFNLVSKDNNILDTNGREFNDLAAAHRHAMLLINKIIFLTDEDWQGWSINVTDASNRSMLSVLFPSEPYPQYSSRATQLHRDNSG